MIITKLHIENFGKLHDFDMNFTDGINQIYKENGWGKSSLSIFIKALLYGMPAKARGDSFNYERSRFYPWQGGLYGGFLQIKTANIEYKITRFFGKTPEGDSLEILDLTNNQKLQNLNREIGEILFGVGRESFEVTAFFPQLKFISSANSQITASLTGADKFQNDLANFNQAIKIIDAKISSLKKEKPKKEDIENLHRHIDENKTLIEIESKKKLNCREKLNNFDQQKLTYQIDYERCKSEFSEKQMLFDKKLKIEEKLRDNSNKLNEYLVEKNQILEKIQQEDKKVNENKNAKTTNILSIVIPLVFVILIAVFSSLTIVGILKVIIGVCLSLIMLVLGFLSEFLILRRKRNNKRYDNKNSEGLLVNKLKEIDNQIKISEEINNQLKEDYKFYNKYTAPNREKLEEIENILNNNKIDIITIKNQIENIDKEIDDLLDKNEKMVNDYNLIKENFHKIDDKIKILTLTKDFMLQARENVSKRFIVPINQSLKNLLTTFDITDRNYIIDTEWNVKEETNFGTKEFQYSSQGLQDIISFCQRINLIDEIYKKEKPVIILDDTFVNLDDKKLKIAKEIIKEIAKTYQIIYICCNEKNIINLSQT